LQDYRIAGLADVLSTYKDFCEYKVAKNEVSFNEAQGSMTNEQ
jgi:hypothetical protein